MIQQRKIEFKVGYSTSGICTFPCSWKLISDIVEKQFAADMRLGMARTNFIYYLYNVPDFCTHYFFLISLSLLFTSKFVLIE